MSLDGPGQFAGPVLILFIGGYVFRRVYLPLNESVTIVK